MSETTATGVQPVQSDVAVRALQRHREPRRVPWAVLGVIAAGGGIGALARYGLVTAFPHQPGAFPWATFVTNIAGCLLIGVFMVLFDMVWAGRRLVRPFLGVGVLGGFTTFSTAIVDTQQALTAGAPGIALVYLAGTLVAALVAVWVGGAVTGWLVRSCRRGKGRL